MSFAKMKFGDFIRLQRGHDLTKDQIVPGPYPVVSSTTIIGYHNAFRAKAPGVVIGRSGTLGEAQYLDVDYWPHNTSLYVKDFKGNNPRFVYYFLKSFGTENSGGGSAVPTLNRNHLNILDVCIPDITTQSYIANILCAYDDLIENNQKQIKLLEEAAQRLYKEWFVDLRFPGYENVKVIDGVPEGWRSVSILDNDIFIFAKGNVQQFDGEKQYYATADVEGTSLVGSGVPVSFSERPSRANIQPQENSVWFARMSNSYKILNCYGKNAQLAENSIISTGFAGFKACPGCYGFVYETVASERFDEEKNRFATGATQVSLTNEGLKRINVILPTKSLVQQYSEIIEPYMQKAELLKCNIKKLAEARDRLLPRLMSGEINV